MKNMSQWKNRYFYVSFFTTYIFLFVQFICFAQKNKFSSKFTFSTLGFWFTWEQSFDFYFIDCNTLQEKSIDKIPNIFFSFSHKFHRFYVVKNYFSNDFSFNTDCTTFKCALFVYVYAVCYYFMDSKKFSSFKYVGCNTYDKIRNHYIQCACLPEIEYGKLIRSGEHEQKQEGSQIDSKNVMENMKQFHLSVSIGTSCVIKR